MWEYKVHKFEVGSTLLGAVNIKEEEIEKTFNLYGVQGWELVSALDINSFDGVSSFIVATFKRPMSK